MNLWVDATVMASMFALGNILFGHFEERTPKWRRVLKFFVVTGGIVLLSATAGRAWSTAVIAALLSAVAVIHGWWLPTRHGINGWTGEPRAKYYAFRGWKM
jgi:hypothetical protein